MAYTHIKDVKHLTILLSVDPSNLRNGGLEVVDASQNMDIPVNKSTNCLEQDWCDQQNWTPVELEAGMLSIDGESRWMTTDLFALYRPAADLLLLLGPS